MILGNRRWGIGLLIAVLVLPAVAGDDENRRELKHAEKRVKELLHKAEALREEGRHEEAKKLLHKAEELQVAIKRSRKYVAAKRGRGGDTREILNDLERGAKALRRLKRIEEAEHLEGIAREMKEKLAQRERREHDGRGERRERDGRGERGEREILQHELEVMRMAFTAFREAEKKDAAELIEHAIHARELRLERRRDKEAVHVMETAPKPGQLAEMLMMASELWADWGHEKKAVTCAELGKRLGRKRGKGREHREERGREHLEAAMHRIERLNDRLAALERTIAELNEQLQQLKRKR